MVEAELTSRVEANGKHYMAGGYPFTPLTFTPEEADDEA
jgi:V-type H+-transporting ATPase subunit a